MSRFVWFIFFVLRTSTTVLLTFFSLRVVARIFAFPSHDLHIRRAAEPSVIAFHSYVFAERFAPHLRRVATLSALRRSAFALNQISLLSYPTLHYLLLRAVRRGLNRSPAPRPCSSSFCSFMLFPLVDSPAASFEILFVLYFADR